MSIAEREVMRMGLVCTLGSQKEVGRYVNQSEQMMSLIFSGQRRIADDIKHRMSEVSFKAGVAIASENTGYTGLFSYIDCDRHPQNLIRRVEREDREADDAVQRLSQLLIDKFMPEDFTAEDKQKVREYCKEIVDDVREKINLLMESYERCGIGVPEEVRKKKKGSRERAVV